jgi:hypothetical protein
VLIRVFPKFGQALAGFSRAQPIGHDHDLTVAGDVVQRALHPPEYDVQTIIEINPLFSEYARRSRADSEKLDDQLSLGLLSPFHTELIFCYFPRFHAIPRRTRAREDQRMAAAMQLDSKEPQDAMLITIEELRRWFREDSATLVNRLQEETGRYGSDEAGQPVKRRELIRFHEGFSSEKLSINCWHEHGQRNPGGDSKAVTRGNRANPHVD